jgi:hypothetical protein
MKRMSSRRNPLEKAKQVVKVARAEVRESAEICRLEGERKIARNSCYLPMLRPASKR